MINATEWSSRAGHVKFWEYCRNLIGTAIDSGLKRSCNATAKAEVTRFLTLTNKTRALEQARM